MARIRTIKPELWQSESMGRLSREARLLFIGLISQADDEGRIRASSRGLASLLLPFDALPEGAMDGWLGELERESMFYRYDVDGSTFGCIRNFVSHQKIDRPTKSKLPAPREASRALAKDRAVSVSVSVSGGEGRGPEAPPSPPPPLVHVGTDFLASDAEMAAAKAAPLPFLVPMALPKGFRDWRMLHPVFVARIGEDGDTSAWESLWRDCEPHAWAIFQAMATACRPAEAGKRLYFNIACEWINRACPHQEEAQG